MKKLIFLTFLFIAANLNGAQVDETVGKAKAEAEAQAKKRFFEVYEAAGLTNDMLFTDSHYSGPVGKLLRINELSLALYRHTKDCNKHAAIALGNNKKLIRSCSRNCPIRPGFERAHPEVRKAAWEWAACLLDSNADVKGKYGWILIPQILVSSARGADAEFCNLLLRVSDYEKLREKALEQMKEFEELAQEDPAIQEVLDDHRVESQPNRKIDLSAALHTQTILPTAVINLIISQI